MNILRSLLLTAVLSFSACQNFNKSFNQNYEPISLKNETLSYSCGRAPASALMCSDIFSKIAQDKTEIIENFPEDIGLSTQINSIRKQLKSKGQLEPVTESSKRIAEFRIKYLPYFKIDSMRESIVKWMEAELRLKSLELKNKLKTVNDLSQYDAVIVGTGVHGIITLHSLLAEKPKMKVLIIDSSDTGGGTFRYAGDTFNINSSNRPSGSESLPLPGKGNINELPGLPIQVSDISPVKYPSAGDLGSALVAGLYSGVFQHKNVDILLSTDATSVSKVLDNNDFKYKVKMIIDSSATEKSIETQKVIVSTGLGSPQIPEGIAKSIRKYPELISTNKIDKKLPRVMTFEDVMRVISQSNDPKKYFANKKIAVVGVGDSANVFIEFLLGYASRSGYAQSDGQTPGPKKVFWIGQEKETCEQFISDIRSRYAQIGTGYRSSDPSAEPIITGIPPRLEKIKPAGKNKILGKLSEQTSDGTKEIEADLVILATGYKGGLAELFKDLIPENILNTKSLKKDSDFLDLYFNFLERKTTTSDGELTRVAKYAKTIGSSGRELSDDPGVFVVGPAAGKLPKDNELVGIIQNSVSIFNNAPRTYATGTYIAKATKNAAKNDTAESKKFKLSFNASNSAFLVKGLSEVKNLGTAAQPYLFSVGKKIAQEIELGSGINQVNIEFSRTKDGITISTSDSVQIDKIVEAFSETRDFFNVLNQVLLYNPDVSLYLNSSSSGNNIAFKQSSGRALTSMKSVENNSIVLRGIN